MTVLFLRSSFSSTLQEKSFTHLFDKIVDDYLISHVTPYLSKHAKHPS